MSYTVSFDAASLIHGLGLQVEAAIAQAVQNTALTARAVWQQTVLQTPGLWAPLKDRYAASIKVEYDASGMGARIYSDDPMATLIETGIPARDLKRMLDTSLKTRVVKSGKHAGQRYMIIPFRIQTPGNTAHGRDMPQSVYEEALKLKKSKVTFIGYRENQLGVMGIRGVKEKQLLTVRARTYKWGERLDGDHLPKNLRGMVRFNTSSGGQKSSAYMTFRVLTEWSTGWIVPAQPGRYIVKSVSEQAQIMLKDEVTQAIASVS